MTQSAFSLTIVAISLFALRHVECKKWSKKVSEIPKCFDFLHSSQGESCLHSTFPSIYKSDNISALKLASHRELLLENVIQPRS